MASDPILPGEMVSESYLNLFKAAVEGNLS